MTVYGDIIVAILAPVTASEEPHMNLVTGGIFLSSAMISISQKGYDYAAGNTEVY